MSLSQKDFPGNSIVEEPSEKQKIKRVAKGTVRQRKEPFLDRVFGGETSQNIVQYIVWEVLVPAAKSTISDIVTNTIEMALYGDTSSRRSSRLRRERDRTVVSYNSMYDRRPRRSASRPPRRAANRHRFDSIIFESRVDAEDVLSTLVDCIEQYEMVTVADFYDASGQPSEHTDRRFGWESLHEATVHPVRGGFIIDLPKPYPIE